MNGNGESYAAAHHLVDALELVDDVDAAQDADHRDGEVGDHVQQFRCAQPLLRHLRVRRVRMPHGGEKCVNIEEKVDEVGDGAPDDVAHHRLLLQIHDVLREVAHHVQQSAQLHAKLQRPVYNLKYRATRESAKDAATKG